MDSQKRNTVLDTGCNRRKAFVHIRARYWSRSIVKAQWCVYLLSGLHPSNTGVKYRLWTPAGQRRGRYGTAHSGQSLYALCTAGRIERNRYSTCRADVSMAQTWVCIEVAWNISPCVAARCDPLRFITCPATNPKPTSWRTTSCIHRQHPSGGRRERQKMCCAGGTGWCRCHQREPHEVCRGYSEWEWRTGWVSCSQAHKPLESR